MVEYIVAGILFLVALVAFVFSIRSFFEKGILLHNEYLYASETKRLLMNKKPYYRQCAVVFFLIGMIFLLNGLGVMFHLEWMGFVVMAILFIAIVYVVVSSKMIEKNASQIKK